MRSINNNLGKFLTILLFGVVTISNAQQINTPSYFSEPKEILTGGDNTSTILNFTSTPLPSEVDKTRTGNSLRENNISAKLYLKLDLGDDFVVTGDPINYTINYIVTTLGPTNSYSGSLVIDSDNPEQLIEINLLTDFNNTINPITGINISLNSSMSPITPVSLTDNYVIANARITAIIVREYAVDVRFPSEIIAPSVQLTNAVPTGRIINFNWQTNGTEDFPNYEIQILRLYNTDESNALNNSGIISQVDWDKALRVETQSPLKTIPLTIAEGTGFYVWRVRPIGNYHKGGIANQDNYGTWNNSSLTQGASISLDPANVLNRTDAFYFTDPDENINWIYNRVFTEGNLDPANSRTKTSEGMSYADGLLRARQTQAYNSSNNTTLVTQTISDYSGRPALTTLPVPVGNGLTGYKTGFVKNTVGTLYTALDYDIDDGSDKISDPTPIDQSTTDFDYYDGTNVNGVANAEGYPFKRTLFKTDGTGRVTEESGVGKVHALGTQGGTLGGGRTTRVLFGTPSDDELIRIFGDEAPLAESVIKTLTIDPNNVVSVTYTSKEGKTIATALISDGSDNLVGLDVKDLNTLTVSNTANQNIVSNNKMISSRRIALEVAKPVTLSYSNSVSVPMGACAGGDCGLKLRFFLNDLKTGETFVSNADRFDSSVNLFDVGSSINFNNFTDWEWDNLDPNSTVVGPTIISNSGTESIFQLTEGEYIITKEVFSTNNPNFVEDNMIEYGEQYTPIINALADQIAAIVNPSDYAIFQNTYLPGLQALITTYQTTPTQANSDLIVNYLVMDVLITGPTPYLFPLDFTIPPNFMEEDSGDPSQNTMTVSMGCCGNLEVPMPKPDVCVVCNGVSDVLSSETLTNIKAQIDADILADVPLTYGINDILNHGSSIFSNTGNDWTTDIYNTANPISDWNMINKIVGHEFMDYLYRKLADEGFIDLYNSSSFLNGYDSDNPTLFDPTHVDNEGKLQDFFDKFAPGFTYTSMQFMVTNMLVSRYHEGQSKEHPTQPGVYFKAKENDDGWLVFTDAAGEVPGAFASGGPITGDNPLDIVTGIDDGNIDEFNYDCQELFECWIQAVELINAFEFDDDMNVMDSFNDEQGGDSSEDHFDDDESKEDDDGSWLMDQIISMIVSAKMRDFQDDEAVVPLERLEALVSFPKIFMECAGYKYAAILDETAATTLPSDYIEATPYGGTGLPATFNPNPIGGGIIRDYSNDISHAAANSIYAPILIERDAQGLYIKAYELNCGTSTSCKSDVLFYEYTLKPEWLFKYFVYNAYSGNPPGDPQDDFLPILNQFQVEVTSCYQSMFESICATEITMYAAMLPSVELVDCNGESCRYFHESWSAGQRLNFYQQLEGGRKCSEFCNPSVTAGITIGPSPDCEPLKDNLLVLANDKLDNAIAVCEYRRGEIKSGIIKELIEGCWDIVECATLAYEISEAQIDLMVDEVVASCVSQINGTTGIRKKLDGGLHPNPVNTADLLYNPTLPYGPSVNTDYPKCEIISCGYVDIVTRGCLTTTKKVTVLFPECDQLILDQINSWNFEPSIGIADFDGDGIYGVNANGTPKDLDDAPFCINYVNRDWQNSPLNTTCVEHVNCTNVQCTQNGQNPINTYSSTNNIPQAP